MNNIVFIIFLVFFLLFLLSLFIIKKTSIKEIVVTYFRNYFSNAFDDAKRKFSIFIFLAFGIAPYILGALLFISFKHFFVSFSPDLLFQLDIVLLTIFSLFIAFDFKKEGKEVIKNELIATLLVGILLIVTSLVVLLFASSLPTDDLNYSLPKNILLSIYYALNFKIIVLLFYSLKRMFVLSKN